MNTWEYHVEAGPTDWGAIQQTLNQAGSEGWELVAAGLADGYQEGGFLSEGTQILGGQFFAVFKRPGNGWFPRAERTG
jgi:hypothetical protein